MAFLAAQPPPTPFGTYLAFALSYAGALLAITRGKVKFFAAVSFVLIYVCAFLTWSRSQADFC